MARNKEERIARRQEHLKRLNTILETMTTLYNNGRAGPAELRQAEYYALNAEIELEREKMR
jgi:outer membrane protein TolC